MATTRLSGNEFLTVKTDGMRFSEGILCTLLFVSGVLGQAHYIRLLPQEISVIRRQVENWRGVPKVWTVVGGYHMRFAMLQTLTSGLLYYQMEYESRHNVYCKVVFIAEPTDYVVLAQRYACSR